MDDFPYDPHEEPEPPDFHEYEPEPVPLPPPPSQARVARFMRMWRVMMLRIRWSHHLEMIICL